MSASCPAARWRDFDCQYVLLGHSERRSLFGEMDTDVAEKFVAALRAGLTPVLCIGETQEQRLANETDSVVSRQLDAVIDAAGIAAFADAVIAYDALQDIDNRKPTTIVDMSGNGTVLSDLHAHLGDQMMFTSNVGVTHYDANEMGPQFIRERSAMFFAPGHIQKRTKEWGPGEFERKAFEFWHGASIKSRDWLEIVHHSGMDNLAQVFAQVLNGKTEANKGIIVSPEAEIEARNTTTI